MLKLETDDIKTVLALWYHKIMILSWPLFSIFVNVVFLSFYKFCQLYKLKAFVKFLLLVIHLNIVFTSSPEEMFIDCRERKGGERWEQRERETNRQTSIWERNIYWLLPICTLTGDGTHNLDICPDWEWNLQTFWVQDAPATS